MSKKTEFLKFKPDYSTLGFGWLEKLFKHAFDEGSNQIDLDENKLDFLVEGMVHRTDKGKLNFGHLPKNGHSTSIDLSGAAPYRLTVKFKTDETLDNIELILYFVNPRIVLSDDWFYPARLNGEKFEALTSDPAPCGLMFEASPDETPEGRSDALLNDLPALDILPVGDFETFGAGILVGRFDISLKWEINPLSNSLENLFGRNLGVPNFSLPENLVTAVKLFSPRLPDSFEGLMTSGKWFGIRLKDTLNNTIQIITEQSNQGAPIYFEKAAKRFGLPKDFEGFVFEGLEIYKLNDKQKKHPDYPNVSFGITAVSFGDQGWYTGIETAMPVLGNSEENSDSYLGLFLDATISVSLSNEGFKHFTISGKFREFKEPPFIWLSGRRATLSLHEDKVFDNFNVAHNGYYTELSLERTDEDVIATIKKDNSDSVSADLFNSIGRALTLGAIVLAPKPVEAPDNVHLPNDKTRRYFVPVGGPQRLAQLYLISSLGGYFLNSLEIEEIRVTGIHLQKQLVEINPKDEYQTGLLFDYEIDYQINLEDKLGIKTTKPVTAKIDGTGFCLGGKDNEGIDKFQWVQIPDGVRELSIADPSLWDLKSLGKILKIVDISFRRSSDTDKSSSNTQNQVVIRLRLSGNIDKLAAGDFVFVIPLDGSDPKIEAFPSKIVLDLKDTFKATGTLTISKKNGGQSIIGTLEIIFADKFRIFGAIRFDSTQDADGKKVTAVIISAAVDFPQAIPIAGTPLGWSGIEGIVAYHMKRLESVAKPPVPAALQWLSDVKGDVVNSVTTDKWGVDYERNSIGLGIMVDLMISKWVINLNAMLMIEPPGPRTLIFAKANVFKAQKNNQEIAKGDELIKGILGILDIDPIRKSITLGALAELEFKNFIKVRAPIEIFFDMRKLSNWHIFIGTKDDPVRADLDIFKIIKASAEVYNTIEGEVQGNPGLKIGMGFSAQVTIGGAGIFIDGGIGAALEISLANGIFAQGNAGFWGRMHLYVVNIGISGSLSLNYFKPHLTGGGLPLTDGSESLHLRGEICGHYEDFFIEVSGCIRLEIGWGIDKPTVLPPLVENAGFIPGVDVALHGQGQLGPIDEVMDPLKYPRMPLDVVIGIPMHQPPSIGKNAKGFAQHLKPQKPVNNSTFQLGTSTGSYRVDEVLLKKKEGGNWVEIDYKKFPARWWINSKPTEKEPASITLALLTRNPLSVQNGAVSSSQLNSWIESIYSGICELPVDPQRCFYALSPGDYGRGDEGKWTLPAVLCNPETEERIGRTGNTDSHLELQEPNFGLPPGFPRRPGLCIVEYDGFGQQRAVLTLYARIVSNNSRVLSSVKIKGDISRDIPLEILIAHKLQAIWQLSFELKTSKTIQNDEYGYPIGYNTLIVEGYVEDLSDPQVLKNFHEDCSNWKLAAESFASLSGMFKYADHEFRVLKIPFDKTVLGIELDPDEIPKELIIRLNIEGGVEEAPTVIVGGYRYLPLAEVERFENDRNYHQETLESLREYLEAKEPIPLLEKNSDYQLTIEWTPIIDNQELPQKTFLKEFSTTNEPPKSVTPYLLTSYPQFEEKNHYSGDQPGFGLASDDLLRILGKFDARLKVTITNDGGSEVTGKTNAGVSIRWDQGVRVNPAELKPVVGGNPPPEFDCLEMATLPSALRAALDFAVRNGTLNCLPAIELNGGIWIGFKVDLKPLTGYRIAVDIVNKDGSPWKETNLPDDASKTNELKAQENKSFLEWRFSTGLHLDMKAHVKQINGTHARHRALVNQFNTRLTQNRIIEAKLFEDMLASAMGERSERTGEARVTILWREDKSTLKACAVLIESCEPLYRTTLGVRIKSIKSNPLPESSLVAEAEQFELQSIDLETSPQIESVTYSSGGFSCLVIIKEDLKSENLSIKLKRNSIDRIPTTAVEIQEITIQADLLAEQLLPKF